MKPLSYGESIQLVRAIPFESGVFPVSGNITWTLSAALTAGRGSINLYFC